MLALKLLKKRVSRGDGSGYEAVGMVPHARELSPSAIGAPGISFVIFNPLHRLHRLQRLQDLAGTL